MSHGIGRILVTAVLLLAATARASDYAWDLAWRSPADETFYGFGDPRNVFDPASDRHPLPGGLAKHNGTYAWGVTSYKDDIWYGINDNGGCKYTGPAGVPLPAGPDDTATLRFYTFQSPHEVCDWKENDKPYSRFYIFHTRTGKLETYGLDNPTFLADMKGMAGTRSAGTLGKLVFLAGLRMSGIKVTGDALRIYVFNGETKQYLGYSDLAGYVNMRSMRTFTHADGSQGLYLAVEGAQKDYHVLRWTGTPQAPFATGRDGRTPGFERVIDNGDNGLIGDFDAYTAADGRQYIVAVTWLSPTHSGGLYISDALPRAGFTAAQPGHLRTVMRLEDFDPDPFIARAWMTGSLSIYKGYAYWGTMMVAAIQTQKLFSAYPNARNTPETQDLLVRASMERAGHVFRTSLADPRAPVTEMLYGSEYFRTYDPASDSWSMKPNRMGWKPRFGSAGLGYLTNNYTWTSFVYKDRLFLGTFDFSGVLDDYANYSAFKPPQHDFLLHKAYRYAQQAGFKPGGDLFVFEDDTHLPRPLSHDGLGNPGNTGFRNFVVVNGVLYVGTSSSWNIGEHGGYEFYRIHVKH